MEITSIFTTILGLIVGLGAVLVIDIHGFLGQKSSYWTEATTRTHKVTKPLIWIGITFVFIGTILANQIGATSSLIFYIKISLISLLVLNGLFLSLVISPAIIQKEKEGRASELLPKSLQNKIVVSLLFSDIGWWALTIIFVYSLNYK